MSHGLKLDVIVKCQGGSITFQCVELMTFEWDIHVDQNFLKCISDMGINNLLVWREVGG